MNIPRLVTPILFLSLCFLSCATSVQAQFATETTKAQDKRELEIASRFSPVFYQSLGSNKRADYITNFDFDGDWRGDNNWIHTNDNRFPMKAFVYYAVVETETHYFIHFAVFHGRDYKGGEERGTILSELMREGAKRAGKYDPTGIAEESALAHENDFEGCLVVVAKAAAGGHVVYLETLRHNTINHYAADRSEKNAQEMRVEGDHTLLYVEPKGHGILPLTTETQTTNKEILIYEVGSRAEDPEKTNADGVQYALLPLQTLWARAQGGVNVTYGETQDFGKVTISVKSKDASTELKTDLKNIGIAFAGSVGGLNMARPPWGWFDRSRREQTLGLWFFDPAKTIKRDFRLTESFSTTYLEIPFWAATGKASVVKSVETSNH